MITYLFTLPVGNAVRGALQPPAGAEAFKVLRKDVPTFSGHDDPAAVVVSENERYFLDAGPMANGVQLFYRPYYLVGGVWVTDAPVSATPIMDLGEVGPDALQAILERLEWGLKEEVTKGVLFHKDGYIPVLSAPPVYEDTQFPIVTLHLTRQTRHASGIGEMISADAFNDGEWTDGEGVLWAVTLSIVCWVVGNADTRIDLRKAVNRLLLGNLPVFADKALSQMEWSMQDTEDFESYNAPVYQSIFTLTCIAPNAVTARHAPISDVQVDVQAL